ncbi:MAG: MFS transporter [Deltaproteobacteria bacterium]|nr:MFS transporter [Deltaproteobacteria bacterium]
MLSTFACLGLGRFAIGMLLPSMASSLGLSYDQMGMIGTVNFTGYLLAVLVSGFLANKLTSRYLIFLSLILVGVSMISISRSQGYYSVLFLYFLTGIGSGAANVPMMSLVSSWFSKTKRGKAAGYMVIGSGFAILFTGFLVPYLNIENPQSGWRLSWIILGLLVLAVSLICVMILRDDPKELGLNKFGAVLESAVKNISNKRHLRSLKFNRSKIYHLGIIYFIFGFVYSSYVTFIVTALMDDSGFSEVFAGNLWSWIGFFSLFSGPVFGGISDKIRRKYALAIVFSIHFLSYLFIAAPLPIAFTYLSIFFFGIVSWSIPSIMAALVGDYVDFKDASKMFGIITFIFAIGQISGPFVTGFMADAFKHFKVSFYIIAGFSALAVILSMTLKDPELAE